MSRLDLDSKRHNAATPPPSPTLAVSRRLCKKMQRERRNTKMEDSMSRAEDEVSRLLAGASKTMASARCCWLVTSTEAGGVDARPMGRLPPDPDDSEWTLRFITDARSHKAAETRRASQVAVIFQHNTEDAYVTVVGAGSVHDSAAEVRRLWKPGYDPFFPSETDKANAIFIEVDARRLELWIRGVTPEPFAMQTTVLERDAGGAWRLMGGEGAAA
jgi:general stress protein 26